MSEEENDGRKYDEIDKDFGIDEEKIRKNVEYENIKEREEAEIEPEHETIQKNVFEEIVKTGRTMYDRGIVKGGKLVEERPAVDISFRNMPSYINMSLHGMMRRHKNLYSLNRCYQFVTKAGIYKYNNESNIRPVGKIKNILNRICLNMRHVDNYYIELIDKKLEYALSSSTRKHYENFWWVDGNIGAMADDYNLNKSTAAVIICMYGLSSSNGHYVVEEVFNKLNRDINIFNNFINNRYSLISDSILRILTDSGSLSPKLLGFCKTDKILFNRIKNINEFDKKLYIKIVELLKEAGVENDSP